MFRQSILHVLAIAPLFGFAFFSHSSRRGRRLRMLLMLNVAIFMSSAPWQTNHLWRSLRMSSVWDRTESASASAKNTFASSRDAL